MRPYIVVICLLVAAPAAAQSTSIGVTANWDLARFSRLEIDDDVTIATGAEDSLDGEALGFSVNARRAIGEHWGVAVEFSRSGEIESRATRRVTPLRPGGTTIPSLPGVTQIPTIFPPIPDFEFVLETEQQHQTVGALLWARQELSDRVDLSYAGGITFVRSEFERQYTITDPRLAIFVAPTDLSTIDFSVGATVGVDADVELTEHTAFTAGVRLQSISSGGRGGWLIRPGVGVRWTF